MYVVISWSSLAADFNMYFDLNKYLGSLWISISKFNQTIFILLENFLKFT